MDHINKICSLKSKLSFVSICSVRILGILEVIAKIAERSTLDKVVNYTRIIIICSIRGTLIQIFSALVPIGFHMINEPKVMKKLNNSKKSSKAGRLVLRTQKVNYY